MPSSEQPPVVLVVCTGNVCRSPYLERRLAHELDASWGPGAVSVASAGTGALVGHPMDPDSLSRLAAVGVDGTDFVARDITKQLVADASLVVTATRAHRTAVSRMYPKALKTTHALRDLAQLAEDVELPPAPADVSPREWLATVVPLLAARRGVRTPLADADADVIDPFRQGPEVFDLMTHQIEACIPALMRVLGRPH